NGADVVRDTSRNLIEGTLDRPLSTSSREDSCTIIALACESPKMWAISSDFKSGLTGTIVAPMLLAPKKEETYPGRFGNKSPTRSPLLMPSPESCVATAKASDSTLL